MTERDTIRQALYDAIGWQQGLAEAWQDGSPEQGEALEQIKKYRRLLKKRYGHSQLPAEKALEGTKLVTLEELRAQAINPEISTPEKEG